MSVVSHIAELSQTLEIIRADVFRASFRIRPKAGTANWTGYTMALEVYTARQPVVIANTTNLTSDGWVNTRIDPAATTGISWSEGMLVWVLTEPGGQSRSILRCNVRARFRWGF